MIRLKILWYRLFKRSIMEKCLESAFEDIQLLIKEVFINVSKMPGQLSFDEFVYLFGKYDWKDIIDTLEELDNGIISEDCKKLSKFQLINMEGRKNMQNPIGCWGNSYFFEFINSTTQICNY